MGDFNGHNTLWGSTRDNTRGRRLERWLDSSGLVLLNTGEDTHFCSATGTFSSIDLTLCSPVLAPHFLWRALPDLHSSDHFPLCATYEGGGNMVAGPRRWCLRQADWQSFIDHIVFRDIASFADADSLVEHFSSVVIQAAEASIPRSSGMPRRPPVPWWNAECRDAIRARKKALRAFRSSPTLERRVEFLRLRAKARRIVKESKRASWLSFVEQMNRSTPASAVWGRLRAITGKRRSPLSGLVTNGTLRTAPDDIATIIGETFAEISSTRHYDQHFQLIKAEAERRPLDFNGGNEEPYNVPFSEWELQASIARSKDTAPGPDGIHYQMLRRLPPVGMAFLLEMFNFLWASDSFPSVWREAIVVPIPKPGKDPLLPGNYRPISLTSCVCKIYERMINWRLVWFLETNGLLSNVQCGFRRNRSPIDHLVALETAIREAFLKKQHLVAVLYDMEKAYDKAWRYGILRTIHGWGLRGRLPLMVRLFMTGRRFRVRVGAALSDSLLLENGVPQGSVLSVTLFAIAINPIADIVRWPVQPSLFVDDFGNFTSGHSLPAIERRLQLTINRVHEWAKSNGFQFSAVKTTCIHFHRVRGLFLPPTLYIGGNQIPVSLTARFLGLLFDQKLTWTPHLKALRTRCLVTLNVLRSLSGTTWGADRTVLLRVYHALVRSKLDYGCFVYGSACKTALRMLDSVHHRGIRLATGAFHTSPILSLYAESGELSLENRRQYLLLRYAAKLKSMAGHPTFAAAYDDRYEALFAARPTFIPSIGLRVKTIMDTLDVTFPRLFPVGNSVVPPWQIPRPSCNLALAAMPKISTSSITYQQEYFRLVANYDGFTKIFTDGSKSSDAVGCAVVSGDRTLQYRLSPLCSNYTAELVAIRQALRFILRQRRANFLVLSDSLGSLQEISGYLPSDPLVQTIQDVLFSISGKGSTVVFCWVPGHVGIRGNEQADVAARAAASLPDIHFQGVHFSDLFGLFRRVIRARWNDEWTAETLNKLRTIKATTRAWPSSFRNLREEETALTRLRIGHSRLTHSHLLRGEDQPSCTFCGDPLTVRHVLCDCPEYDALRTHFNITNDLAVIVGDDERHLKTLFQFLKETGLLSRL